MEKKQPGERFAFDLENELKEKPTRKKQILDKAEKRIQEIKKLLREGGSKSDFDRFGILLLGYAALQKVLRKVTK